jgi:hypothetical protein
MLPKGKCLAVEQSCFAQVGRQRDRALEASQRTLDGDAPLQRDLVAEQQAEPQRRVEQGAPVPNQLLGARTLGKHHALPVARANGLGGHRRLRSLPRRIGSSHGEGALCLAHACAHQEGKQQPATHAASVTWGFRGRVTASDVPI